MDLETFRKLAVDRRVVPVSRRLLADGDTPVGLYRKLAGERVGTFLLESADGGTSQAEGAGSGGPGPVTPSWGCARPPP